VGNGETEDGNGEIVGDGNLGIVGNGEIVDGNVEIVDGNGEIIAGDGEIVDGGTIGTIGINELETACGSVVPLLIGISLV